MDHPRGYFHLPGNRTDALTCFTQLDNLAHKIRCNRAVFIAIS
jgi:hypothetical protein